MSSRRTVIVVLAVLLVFAGAYAAALKFTDRPASAVTEPSEGELTPGWDEPGDTPTVDPSDLSQGEITDLLRIPATTPTTPTTCQNDQVSIAIQFTDAATGHRFGRLTVTNTSQADCDLHGSPGFGGRGEWGKKFLWKADQLDTMDQSTDAPKVTIKAGESAYSNVEWTGELAGAVSEPIDLLVIQLAAGQDPMALPVTGQYSDRNPAPGADGMPLPNSGLDISMLTTVRMGPFRTDGP